MKIKVKQGQGAVIATHVGKGEERRMIFIAPWGCSLSTPKPAPEKADLSSRAYTVEATGEVERLLRAAVNDRHPGLVDRIEIVEDPAQAAERVKAEKDAEAAKLKAEKDAEAAKLKAEKDAEAAKLKAEKDAEEIKRLRAENASLKSKKEEGKQ